MIKETIIPTSTIYALNIPETWIGKPVTIVYDKEWIETNATEKNDAIELKKKSFEEAEKFYNSAGLDFNNFKFDRDEANER